MAQYLPLGWIELSPGGQLINLDGVIKVDFYPTDVARITCTTQVVFDVSAAALRAALNALQPQAMQPQTGPQPVLKGKP
jgi:hypothetical protein